MDRRALKRAPADAVAVDASSRYALIAVQGPSALDVLQPLTAIDLAIDRVLLVRARRSRDVRATVSRTGYTGEDGFEIFVPPQSADRVWLRDPRGRASAPALMPCGLGARDTLRLEAAHAPPRQRHRRDDDGARGGLGWIVGWKKDDFVGARALREQKAGGVAGSSSASRCWTAASRATATTSTSATRRLGVVTSGTQTPFLEESIGMAFLPIAHAAAGTPIRRRHPRPPRPRAGRAEPFYKRAETARPGRRSNRWRIRARSQIHEGPRVDRRRRATAARSASPTSPSNSSATSCTSSCRRSADSSSRGSRSARSNR